MPWQLFIYPCPESRAQITALPVAVFFCQTSPEPSWYHPGRECWPDPPPLALPAPPSVLLPPLLRSCVPVSLSCALCSLFRILPDVFPFFTFAGAFGVFRKHQFIWFLPSSGVHFWCYLSLIAFPETASGVSSSWKAPLVSSLV